MATTKTAKIKRPLVFIPPQAGGSYIDGTELKHRVAYTKPAERHPKVEEADRADTN